MKVKICGITCAEDALAAVAAGADALGFNFCPASPRYLDPRNARDIVRGLPPFVTAVGVFVDVVSPEEVRRIARLSGVSVLQLHGEESPDYCRRLRGSYPLIKALRLGGRLNRQTLGEYPVQAFLLDTYDETRRGGTGKTFDWSLAGSLADLRPIILAGGLTPDNVAAAVRAVRPYAVDVCSGVEARPGKKDPEKLARFVEEVRRACGS